MGDDRDGHRPAAVVQGQAGDRGEQTVLSRYMYPAYQYNVTPATTTQQYIDTPQYTDTPATTTQRYIDTTQYTDTTNYTDPPRYSATPDMSAGSASVMSPRRSAEKKIVDILRN